MDETRFDGVVKALATGSTRRRMLAGLGAMATGALVSRSVTAAPSPKASCHKACNASAKTARASCAGLTGTAKNACLKPINATKVACHKTCNA
jgi:hypothetical protein